MSLLDQDDSVFGLKRARPDEIDQWIRLVFLVGVRDRADPYDRAGSRGGDVQKVGARSARERGARSACAVCAVLTGREA